jgi:hypothetical protein
MLVQYDANRPALFGDVLLLEDREEHVLLGVVALVGKPPEEPGCPSRCRLAYPGAWKKSRKLAAFLTHSRIEK